MKETLQKAVEEFKQRFIEYRSDYKPHFIDWQHAGLSDETTAEEAIYFLIQNLVQFYKQGREDALNYAGAVVDSWRPRNNQNIVYEKDRAEGMEEMITLIQERLDAARSQEI